MCGKTKKTCFLQNDNPGQPRAHLYTPTGRKFWKQEWRMWKSRQGVYLFSFFRCFNAYTHMHAHTGCCFKDHMIKYQAQTTKFITVLFGQDAGWHFKDRGMRFQSRTTIKVYHCVVLTGCLMFQGPCDEVPVTDHSQSLLLCCSDRTLDVVSRTTS